MKCCDEEVGKGERKRNKIRTGQRMPEDRITKACVYAPVVHMHNPWADFKVKIIKWMSVPVNVQ